MKAIKTEKSNATNYEGPKGTGQIIKIGKNDFELLYDIEPIFELKHEFFASKSAAKSRLKLLLQ